MKIFINNQEVLCSSNMQIKESLANTNSVILNNVYPKSWETSKDYVSNFYMPSDYSHCVIKNEQEENIKSDVRFYYMNSRYPDGTENKILADSTKSMQYIPVISGVYYELDITSSFDNSIIIYEADDKVIDTPIYPLSQLQPGENTITIKPTRNYLIFLRAENSTRKIFINYAKVNDKIKMIDLNKNVFNVKDRMLHYDTNKILYEPNYNICYIKVIPNTTYTLRLYNASGTRYICEADSIDIGTTTDRLIHVNTTGTLGYTITPTKNYLVFSAAMQMYNFYYYTPTDVVFSGVIKNSGNINLNPRYPHYATLQLLDYKTFLSEGETLNYVIKNLTIGETIKRIVQNLQGFYVGDIELENDDLIEVYNCNEKTPYDVLEYLAEITGAIWYTESISEDITLIHFKSVDNLPLKANIDYTQSYFEDNNIQDIQYSYSANDYRNKQIITTDRAVANTTQTELITYNGETLQTSYPISSVVQIMINNTTYTAASNVAKKNGIYADFYYTYNSNILDINTDIGTGIVVNIKYYPLVNSRQVAYNQDEIDRIQASTGRNGVISRYEKRTDTGDEKALSQIAQTYIDYKSIPEITIKVQSYNKDLFQLGDRVFFNAPLDDLKTNYLVKEKQTDMIISGDQEVYFYTYSLSSSFNFETAINFFDNQRRKLEGSLSEGQYIIRYIDLPSTTNIIFNNLDITDIEIPKDILDGELDIELVGEEEYQNTLDSILEFIL